MDEKPIDLPMDDQFYISQLEKNLSHNIYKNGHWGSYRHLSLNLGQDEETIHAYGKQEERGNLSSFKWIQGSLNPNT